MKNIEIINLLFNFMFGFNNSSTMFKFRRVEKVFDYGIKYKQEDSEAKNVETLLDYNYSDHDYIRIALFLINSINNPSEHINKVIYVLFESFFEKCPFQMIPKLILPFTGLCIRQYENPNSVFQKTKKYPDTSFFFSLISFYENCKFDYSLLSENLENLIFRTFSHYINNDIDFYYHYQTQREGEENSNNFHFSEDIDDIGESLFTPKREEFSKHVVEHRNDMYVSLRTSLSKLHAKINFGYFNNSNLKQKVSLRAKVFDEMIDIEEEFNNVYVI